MQSAELPKDIAERVSEDFGKEHSARIMQHLLDNIPDGLANGRQSRCIRCILYLSSGDEQKLQKYTKLCLADTRDVVLAAEYEGKGLVRKRNFDKPFSEAGLE